MSNITPIKRDENGLLPNVQYILTDDGRIDWRKMIPSQYLYPNPQFADAITKKFNKLPTLVPITEIPDQWLAITLAGIKYLCYLRGYNSIHTRVNSSSPEYASATTEISFIPNLETEGRAATFSDSGCAHFNNTKGFGNHYLVEIATNRAFCRAVRNFLGINLVSSEELGSKEQLIDTQSPTPSNDLRSKAREIAKSLGFKSYGDITAGFESIEIKTDWRQYGKIDEIPDDKLFFFLSDLQTFKNKK